MLVIRTDGNRGIGSGHVMRCTAMAEEAAADGCGVVFAVSDEEGGSLVEALGYRCEVLGGDCRRLGWRDADALADMAERHGASSVLVDSYAVCDSFFGRLAGRGIRCCYIDDAYSFEGGFHPSPVRWDVSAVVNYGFGSDLTRYESAYAGSSTSLGIGPRFAPVRRAFRDVVYTVRPEVGRVLVTSGMTNPGRALERMAAGCRAALPRAHITVVVGGAADFDGSRLAGTDFEVIEGARDMPGLMASADLAVSAAGTTLYELACAGVPFVALPIVDNQIRNAEGIAKLHMGFSLANTAWGESEVRSTVSVLAGSCEHRLRCSRNGRKTVDGLGAGRIYKVMKGLVNFDILR